MLRQAFDEITADHLRQLVENGVEESRTLEFKADYGHPNGRSRTLNDEQKRELLADVSSFANTGGGDLLFGIREEAGKAVDVAGLDLADPDAELLRVQSILRDNLEPPISGITIRSRSRQWPCSDRGKDSSQLDRTTPRQAEPQVLGTTQQWEIRDGRDRTPSGIHLL
ncbi:ATP-binding protein [Mesorhizobium sp. dw_380]|uniref:AlbA family DNA-binding domain-containing protein n=1 Tax=Mesorhizobium sp. dw_380 TaxID=2812001 RepID=UPI001BDE58B0|nr:ATP-binding protein [Mesorhizobium sp. dw_380]